MQSEKYLMYSSSNLSSSHRKITDHYCSDLDTTVNKCFSHIYKKEDISELFDPDKVYTILLVIVQRRIFLSVGCVQPLQSSKKQAKDKAKSC